MSKGDADVCLRFFSWASVQDCLGQPSPGSSSAVSRIPITLLQMHSQKLCKPTEVIWQNRRASGKVIYFFCLILLFAGFPSGSGCSVLSQGLSKGQQLIQAQSLMAFICLQLCLLWAGRSFKVHPPFYLWLSTDTRLAQLFYWNGQIKLELIQPWRGIVAILVHERHCS